MKKNQIAIIIDLLKEKGVSFDKGLSSEEIIRIEKLFNFEFPEDLRDFLQTQLPVNKSFVHWRYVINSKKGEQEIQERLNWPWEGILFDIKHNSFWMDEWGTPPGTIDEKNAVAEKEYNAQPKLIPIYSHRYIPSQPTDLGNPVFSVYQTDIIYYGYDLMDYFSSEFNLELPESFGKIEHPKKIQFWSKLVERR